MLYQPSLLGLSLLVLTCASSTLGAVEEPSTTTPDSQSTVALVPQPLLRVHRHHYHRQQHQINLIPPAAGSDPRTQLSPGVPGALAPTSPAVLPPVTPAVLPSTGPVKLPQTGSAAPPPISPVIVPPVSAAILPPSGPATLVSTSPGSLPSTSPLVLPSTSPAVLAPTSSTVLSPAVPTQSGPPTANRGASVTAAQSPTTGPIGIGIPSGRTSNPLVATDLGVDAGDQNNANAATTPPFDAVDSSTATSPVDAPVSFSQDSSMPTLLPLAPVPLIPSDEFPSSESQFLTTSPNVPVVASTPSPAASQASSSSSTPLTSPASGSSTLGSGSLVSALVPTVSPSSAANRDLNHPNPASSSPQAERSKKAAVLAGFLILGTLGAIGVALLCSYCGLCRRRRRQDRGISSADRIAEEGLNGDDPPKLVRVNLDEKWSIVPGSPPPTDVEDFVDTLPRDAHSHTLSCSTCPPDSLNGVRGGVPGGGNRAPGQLDPGWVFPNHMQLANLALQPQGENAAPSLAFTNVHLQGPETPSQFTVFPVLPPVEGQASSPSSAGSTPPDKSPVAGRVSTSGDSYMTADSASKYSMASGRRASGVDSVVGSTESDKDSSSGSGGSQGTDSERPSTPDASRSSSTTGSPSVLMTPQQPVGVADVALVASPSPAGVRGGLAIARPGQAAAAGAAVGGEDPDWDVVAAYSYVAREEAKGTSVGELVLRSRETPAHGQKGSSQKAARKKNVRERRATGAGITGKSRVVGPFALGEKKVMVVHGA